MLIGVSDESKGYKLYNPATEKVVTSKDVVFEEEKGWNWRRTGGRISEEPLLWKESDSEVNGEDLNQELPLPQAERQKETATPRTADPGIYRSEIP